MAPLLILSRHPVGQFRGKKRDDRWQDEPLPKNGSGIIFTFFVQVEPTDNGAGRSHQYDIYIE
jgi:hypothetical protein